MKIILSCLLILTSAYTEAQFGGTFMDKDSLYIHLFKSTKVRTVTEFTEVNNAKRLTGRSVYDSTGRLTEFTWNNLRSVLIFDSIGRQCGEQYHEIGSSQASRFYQNKLDEHGHIIQSITGELKNQELDTNIQIWNVPRKNTNVCVRTRSFENHYSGLPYYNTEIDSVDGIYRTYISIEYPVLNWLNERKTYYTSKEMSRTYKIKDIWYFDLIRSKVIGGKELFDYCKTSYERRDNKGRVVEWGFLNYDSVLALCRTPDTNISNRNILPETFIKAVLSSSLIGTVHSYGIARNEYNQQGLIIKTADGFNDSESYSTYNSKNQLVKRVSRGEVDRGFNTKTVYKYNKLGLPVQLIIYPDVKGSTTPYMEIYYSYTFYDQ